MYTRFIGATDLGLGANLHISHIIGAKTQGEYHRRTLRERFSHRYLHLPPAGKNHREEEKKKEYADQSLHGLMELNVFYVRVPVVDLKVK